jgi:regulatory protein
MKNSFPDPAKCRDKARRYCVFQERSQQEVRDKLYSWGLHRKDVEEILTELIGEGYLKEERFAVAFAGGKFRMKQWGRVKIRQALKVKQVSEPLIRQALAAIDEVDYRKTLLKVIAARAAKITEAHPLKRRLMLARYAIQRGFEPELVSEVLQEEE